jgi:restriction endonuclease S subunit
VTGVRVPADCGDPPAGWKWRPLVSLARLETGHTPSRRVSEWWGGEIPWLALPDIRELDGRTAFKTLETTNALGLANSSARLLPKQTVCLSRTASVGFVTVLGVPMATSQDFVNWVCGPDLDPWFLANALIASRDHLRQLASGAIHKTIYMPEVESFMVCLPTTVAEQCRIVAALDKRREELSAVGVEVSKSLLDLEMLLDAELNVALKSASKSVPLGGCLTEVKSGVGRVWSNFALLGATRQGIAPAKELIGKNPERYKFASTGTIFYNPMRILIGSIALVDDDAAEGIVSPDYVVAKPKPDKLLPRFFYYWLRSQHGVSAILASARGAVRERMMFKSLAKIELPLPDIEKQLRFGRVYLAARSARSRMIAQQLERTALESSLLRAAFSGAL